MSHRRNKILYQFLIIILANIFFTPSISAMNDFKIALLPNDQYLNTQYYLQQTKAFDSWDKISTSPEITVAVIDSGVDIEHPDLADNIWRNPGEIPNDKIDNDHNGYVDDINGWDFILNFPDPKPKFGGNYSKLGINHGTIVSGIIGAIGNNNFGISGVSWKIKIMPLKVMDGEGGGSVDVVIRAIEYAIQQKADIINLSMVGSGYFPQLDQVIAKAYQAGIVVVAAAGNENLDFEFTDSTVNLGVNPQYPICHDGPIGSNYVLGVGAVDENDIKSAFSNYGSKCLDLVAPGESFVGILFFSPSIPKYNKYFGGYWSGTSLAAPQVSGAAALLKALRPSLTNKEIYQLLIANSDNIDNKNPDYKGLLGNGRLNIDAAIKAVLALPQETNIIIATATGEKPEIKILDSSGKIKFSFLAFAEKFKGGVNLAIADINNDGQKEIIAAAGKTGGPHVKIFSLEGKLLSQFFAYDKNFSGGVNIVVGDVDGDKQPEIITAPQSGKISEIRIFDLKGALKQKIKIDSGGSKIALIDQSVSGVKNIVTLSNAGPLKVNIYTANGKLISSFKLEKILNNPIINGQNIYFDSREEIIVASFNGSKINYQIYSATGELLYYGEKSVKAMDYNKALNNSDFYKLIK